MSAVSCSLTLSGTSASNMTQKYPCFSEVPEATREASLKGGVSAQKALQGSKTEMRELLGGMEQNSVYLTRVHRFALLANQ